MPVQACQLRQEGAAVVLLQRCEGCNAPASFLEADVHRLAEGDVDGARAWCGWREGRPVCVATKQGELEL
jgi:hypothetical protein